MHITLEVLDGGSSNRPESDLSAAYICCREDAWVQSGHDHAGREVTLQLRDRAKAARREENMLFLDGAAGGWPDLGKLGTAGAALTQHTRPVPKVSERLTPQKLWRCLPLAGAPGAAGTGQELTVPPGRSRHAVLKKITERSRP